MDKIIHLLLQDILNFHSDLERQFVLLPGIRNIGLLESAISTAFQSFDGYDLYPTVHEKAAQLCRGIAKNHPFIDGNKRTALHCMFIYLKANGYIINTTLEEKKSLIIDIASGEKSFEDIVNWLRVYAEEI
ncbi:MAG: type II toxin-antitoxin system death-on-curing family toxin [Veillonella sp. oral taxon 780]|jgi:hypothetical protein|nr:type II toxin-antitoxin system death-on-curing family toxin [Veillonella sp. oral taxon 780]